LSNQLRKGKPHPYFRLYNDLEDGDNPEEFHEAEYLVKRMKVEIMSGKVKHTVQSLSCFHYVGFYLEST